MNDTSNQALLARLDHLEEQNFFQERTLSDLNDALTQQQKQMDQLEKRLEHLEEQIQTLWDQTGEKPESTIPPHYLPQSF